MITVNPEIQIPLWEFDLSYVRSSGPGGQNVNKVNSKAVLRWNLWKSPSLRPEMRARLLTTLTSQLNSEYELVISSDRFRDQIRNREDCFEKFRHLLAAAAHRPKARKETRPSRSSQKRVKESKRRLSEKKSQRRRPRDQD